MPELTQMTMEEFSTLVTNLVGQSIKAAGLDKVDRKFGMFPGMTEDERKNTTKDQRIRTWLKSLIYKDPQDIAQTKYLYEATTAGLGWVPDEFKTDVIRVAENFGVVRRNCTVFPTDAPAVNLHQANGVVTVAWTTEVNQITESTPSFTEPEVLIKKVAGITALSNELLADSKSPIVTYLAELFGEAIAGAEDTQGLIGTGSPFHGLIGGTITGLNANTADSASSYKNFTPDDLLNLAMSVAEKYRAGASYIMNPVVLAALSLAFKDKNDNPILRTPRENGLATTIWGYPVITSEKCPSTDAVSTKFIGFANMKRLYLFDNQAMQVAVATEGTIGSNNLFEKDMSGLRVTERVGLGWTLGAGTATLATHS